MIIEYDISTSALFSALARLWRPLSAPPPALDVRVVKHDEGDVYFLALL